MGQTWDVSLWTWTELAASPLTVGDCNVSERRAPVNLAQTRQTKLEKKKEEGTTLNNHNSHPHSVIVSCFALKQFAVQEARGVDTRVKARRYEAYDTSACLNIFVEEIEARSRARVIF